MSRGQGFTNPWRNPLGELLCSVYMRLVRAEPQVERIVEPPEPVVKTPLNKFCKQCKTGTLHEEMEWVIDGITTYECGECGSVYVTE